MKPETVKIIRDLIFEVERNICLHEETERRGMIWTKCLQCGAMYADDRGGVPRYKEPKAVTAAYAYLKDRGL